MSTPPPVRRTSSQALRYALTVVISVVLASMIGTLVPANAAAPPLPKIFLTGGAAQVSRTYTATSDTTEGSWPAETTELRYQWYRGDHDATAGSFVPIAGAEDQRYTLTDDDHWNTVKVTVQAMNGSEVLAEKSSGPSNWIMYNMAPPVLSGVPHVGHTITATFGPWYTEWWTTLTWRNTGVPIPGENGETYKTRPRDAGKEISLLALGEYEFPNGVHPIDRYAARMRIRWGTKSILRGWSPRRGVLRLTAIAYAAGANQYTVRGHVSLYDGARRVSEFWIPHGRKVVTIRGLRKGVHSIRMVFDQNPWFDASQGTRSFRVR